MYILVLHLCMHVHVCACMWGHVEAPPDTPTPTPSHPYTHKNADKTICVIFSPKKEVNEEIKLKLGGHTISCCTETKFLGVWIDKNLDWKEHVDMLLIKLRQNVGLLKKSKNF